MSQDYVYVGSVVSLYWVVSISMVYLNKVLLSNEDASIPAPIFVTWSQCVVTCIICKVLGYLGEISRRNPDKRNTFIEEFPVVSYGVTTGLSVMPLSVVFVGMIVFNSICLQYVEVSFYNIARSLSLVFNVIFTYFLLGKPTTLSTSGTLLIVILGFIMGINGEINFSLFGTISGVISSIFVSLNSIYTSKVLPKVENDKNVLMYYNNFNAVLLFIPLLLWFEYEIIVEHYLKFYSGYFWVCMTIGGIMGWAIGLVTVMQVKATSPLTHNISGTAKAAVQSLLAFYIWGNEATVKGIMGLLMVIFGSGLYTWVQMNAPVGDKK